MLSDPTIGAPKSGELERPSRRLIRLLGNLLDLDRLFPVLKIPVLEYRIVIRDWAGTDFRSRHQVLESLQFLGRVDNHHIGLRTAHRSAIQLYLVVPQLLEREWMVRPELEELE